MLFGSTPLLQRLGPRKCYAVLENRPIVQANTVHMDNVWYRQPWAPQADWTSVPTHIYIIIIAQFQSIKGATAVGDSPSVASSVLASTTTFPDTNISESYHFRFWNRLKENSIITMTSIIWLAVILAVTTTLSSVSYAIEPIPLGHQLRRRGSRCSGAVYAMTNNFTQNSIIAYRRGSNGQLVSLGTFQTGGRGAALDQGDGVDPLISAESVALVNRKFVLAVNAGSNSVSVLKIENDRRLRLVGSTTVPGTGPVSIAVSGSTVYVASADADGVFGTPAEAQGIVSGFRLFKSGHLEPIRNSVRTVGNRPSTVKFSPDGRFLIVSNAFAGTAELEADSVDELLVFKVLGNGRLSVKPVDSATSTERNDPSGRNLPESVGFATVEIGGDQFVVATEVRSIGPDGNPGVIQTSSVSSWKLTSVGSLVPVDLDVLIGQNMTEGQRGACWIRFSPLQETFWVTNTGSATISTFSFSVGRPRQVNPPVPTGRLPVDLDVSQDGNFLYQMFAGGIGVFRIEDDGQGQSLTPIQTTINVPDSNAQGIVAF